MASSGRKMEDTLSCAICTEVFRNPVTLPCQHSYCRECLQAFAESSSKGGDNADEPAKLDITGTNADASTVETNLSPSEPDPDQPVVICCPVCRRPTDLGTQGVAGLPTNFVLAEIVENFQAGRHPEESGPICGICEEDKNIAVKACSTCSVSYCLECFTSLHPMKGVLKSHVVHSLADYQSKQTTSKVEPGEVTQACDNAPSCEQHGQAMICYCLTCKDLMCVGCIDQHSDHTSSSIQKAFKKEKLTFIEKMTACGESKEKMDECLQKLYKIIDSIKEQERRRRCQVQEEYKTALKALDSWRENALQKLQDEHKKWLDECNGMMMDFQMKLQETENLLMKTKALSSGTDVGFLKELKRIWHSILYHATGVHRWEDENGTTHSCHHQPLSEEDQERRMWIDPMSTAFRDLTSIVMDPRLNKDLEQLTLFKHTSGLESYHSTMLKFASKRLHFHYPAMKGRMQLAVIDHNYNTGRKAATTQEGKTKYRFVSSKQKGGEWTAKTVAEEKSHGYALEMVGQVLARREDPSVAYMSRESFVELPKLPKNIAKEPRPPVEELIAKKMKH